MTPITKADVPANRHEHRYVVRALNEQARELGWKDTDKGGRDYWWRISTCDDDSCLGQFTEGAYDRFPDSPAIGEPLVIALGSSWVATGGQNALELEADHE